MRELEFGQLRGAEETTIDIRGLRYFVQVARAGSLNRASAVLNVAQSALSRQLMKLEDELGVALLVRHGRGVRLTRAGTTLLEHAHAVLLQIDQIPGVVRTPDPRFAGHVVLGVPPAAGLLIAPSVVAELRNRWPQASLQVREGISSSLEEWLLDRRLDVAVLYNPPPLDGVAMTPILHERMVVAGPPVKRGKPQPETIRWRDLSELQLILPSLPHSNRRLIEQAAIQHGVRLNVAFEVDSVAMTKAMVKRGLGATILAFAAVAADAERSELSVRFIERPSLISTVSIGMPRERQPSWLAGELLVLVRDVIARSVADGSWIGAKVIGDHGR
ncbi:LysR family transcriptional regulator [Bradyrhizobium sp. CCGUVB1N3]|uniref:LysR family transcriptional regulator n=1 Tax=Bradyrhizobium sp. CCGUVB1N3 TaxID=2949629 RepID=UPI0020B43F27|nr:LysR family transcriptional regulator [Bradyrhizobium sp. CCGUVB1N3]MCP3473996.1 LysR family transcriptional regulator [Bradyrhizobium sp. CCGUVB1N3]